jgi:hypothetical protein
MKTVNFANISVTKVLLFVRSVRLLNAYRLHKRPKWSRCKGHCDACPNILYMLTQTCTQNLYTVPRRHRRKTEIKHIFLTSAITRVKKSVSNFNCFIHAKETPVLTGYISQFPQLEKV